MLFFGTGGAFLSSSTHLYFTEKNYKKLDELKQLLNITYTQQFAYIFFELSKQDFGKIIEEAKYNKEQDVTRQFTVKRTILKEKLEMLTIQTIYDFADKELPNLFEKKNLMEILLNHYISNSYVYSDEFLSAIKKKKCAESIKYYTLRVDPHLMQSFVKHISYYDVSLKTFILLYGISHQKNTIDRFSYSDFLNARADYCAKGEKGLQPIQFRATACFHPLMDNQLDFNLSEMAELLMLYELKYPNRFL